MHHKRVDLVKQIVYFIQNLQITLQINASLYVQQILTIMHKITFVFYNVVVVMLIQLLDWEPVFLHVLKDYMANLYLKGV